MKRVLLIGLILMFLVACATKTPMVVNTKGTPIPQGNSVSIKQDIGNGYTRLIDTEALVVCYHINYRDTLSCLPLSQTNLSKE